MALQHFVVFLREEDGGPEGWMHGPGMTTSKVTIDGNTLFVIRMAGDREEAFFADMPVEGWDVVVCGRGDVLDDIYDQLEDPDLRDVWDLLRLERRRKTITHVREAT